MDSENFAILRISLKDFFPGMTLMMRHQFLTMLASFHLQNHIIVTRALEQFIYLYINLSNFSCYQNFIQIYFYFLVLLCAVPCGDETYVSKLKSIQDLLNTSKLPISHPLHSKQNRMLMGKLKMQNGILEFCGLRGACYSLLFHGSLESCKSCGIPLKGHESYVRYQTYVNTLLGKSHIERINAMCSN